MSDKSPLLTHDATQDGLKENAKANDGLSKYAPYLHYAHKVET